MNLKEIFDTAKAQPLLLDLLPDAENGVKIISENTSAVAGMNGSKRRSRLGLGVTTFEGSSLGVTTFEGSCLGIIEPNLPLHRLFRIAAKPHSDATFSLF